MKILIIGGKKFVGYHIAKEAFKKGHNVTFFNRGKTYPELLADIPVIIGDRNKDMALLKGLHYDVVIDTCAYFPSQLQKSLDVLKDQINKYVLISSLSAIKLETHNFDESVDIIGLDFEAEEVTPYTYGPLKAACEKQLMDMLGEDGSLIFRPGYIVGNRDHTDRFTFWPVMMKYLDRMLIPEFSDLNYEIVDVKDLAKFVINSIEDDLRGIYHVSGNSNRKFKEFVEICRTLVNPELKFIQAEDHAFDQPEYVLFPQYDNIPEGHVMYSADVSKAFKAGFTQRPIEETILDALNWFDTYKGSPDQLAAGMSYQNMMQKIDEKC